MAIMNGLLVDTDVIIDYLRGFPRSRGFFKTAAKNFVLYLSVITLTEVYSGKGTLDQKKTKEIEYFLSNFEIALITPSVAKKAGELRRDYNRPFADMLIAASALEYGFDLATRNIRHFQGLPKLKIFKPY